ncbi:MAG: DUF4932 domain-containing protein [Theionarchaea archaeon]|nr:DUF4932 domain-containing protein [Theionarchaea archaeon]
MKKICIILVALLIISTTPGEVYSTRSVSIMIHPNIELLSVVLSMTTWMDTRGPPDVPYEYGEDIKEYFSPFKNHDTVRLAQELTDRGFTYDAPPNFILHFSNPPNLEKIYSYSDYIINRARGEDILDEFAESLRRFAVESDFMSFYENHQDFYEQIIKPIQKDIDQQKLVCDLEGFFGYEQATYTIIAAPYMFPGGGYGPRIEHMGKSHCFNILRVSKIEELPFFGQGNDIYYNSLHEFAHSFVNPITEGFSSQVSLYKDLFNPVAHEMESMAYGTWETMLNETIIRAFTSYKVYEEFGPERGSSYLSQQRDMGFYFIVDMFELLLEYEGKRSVYPDFESFYLNILNRLREIRYDEAIQKEIPSEDIKKDLDKDGLSDNYEMCLGTDPNKKDTDDDGIHDGYELKIKTNPLNSDSDNDGLQDGIEEYETNTDPLNSDTDNDGLKDGNDPNPRGSEDNRNLELENEADSHFNQGKEEYEKGNYENALDFFYEAKQGYEEIGSDTTEVEEWISKTQQELEAEFSFILVLLAFVIVWQLKKYEH